jgi:hypothetical protein
MRHESEGVPGLVPREDVTVRITSHDVSVLSSSRQLHTVEVVF